ncbi:hypothetical protein KBC70_00420 [Candidatus Woesebacteria bacterium]|jgi:FKBP-type peptidyl-prolyl cis-trans isomerase (trigger factor)|nr:hypothetical protein [Candidatus Woesebacteria bacterium]
MTLKKLSDKHRTAVYQATIPFKEIEEKFEITLQKIAQETEIEGFRKGKAPIDIVRKTTSKEKVYDELIQGMIPGIYNDAVKMDNLRPFISPKIELKSAKENEDWIIELSIALEPSVDIPDYKKIVEDVRANSKKDDIWVPGKDATEDADAKVVEKKEKFLNDVLKKLMDDTKIEMSQMLIDEEVKIRLSRLVDDVRKIGLTIEAYLKSRDTSQEKLQEELVQDIMNTYKLEYALNQIGDKENITVAKSDVDALLEGIKDPQERAKAEQNAYVYTMMLRKQKIIDFLSGL